MNAFTDAVIVGQIDLRWLPVHTGCIQVYRQQLGGSRIELRLRDVLPNLTVIHLQDCGLGPELPDLSMLPPRLEVLYVSDNQFRGVVDPLVIFAQLPVSLEQLWLYGNRLDFGDVNAYARAMGVDGTTGLEGRQLHEASEQSSSSGCASTALRMWQATCRCFRNGRRHETVI